MARANRLSGVESHSWVYHVTHRCHNREFLLKFRRDRELYRLKLREHGQKYQVSILDYCLTCNHVHLLMEAEDPLELSGFMREVAGEFAVVYNRRKGRMNAFWGDNYHATLVESGQYLWECLCYIELNMVRCGAVAHPRDWEWLGFHEIMGDRQRYRLIDLPRLCLRLMITDVQGLRNNLNAALERRIAAQDLKRDSHWTEAVAVGSVAFLERVKSSLHSTRETEIVEGPGNVWALEESAITYRSSNCGENFLQPFFPPGNGL